MSTDSEKTKDAKPKTTTMDGPAAMRSAPKNDQPTVNTERFIDVGVDVEGYEDARLRRLEPYQAYALKMALTRAGVTKNEDVIASVGEGKVLSIAARFLCGCLVHPAVNSGRSGKPLPAKLLRKGEPGKARLLDELSPEQIGELIVKVIDQAKVWESKRS